MNSEIGTSSHQHKDEISLKEVILKIGEWWRYLWTKKWIIIAAGVLGGALGLFYSTSKNPIYTATTTFVLESGESGGGLGAYAGLASMVGVDLGSGGGGIFQGDNIIELYKSRIMIEKTLFNKLDSTSKQPLIERYIEINNLREVWKKDSVLTNLHFAVDDLNKKFSAENQRVRDGIIGNVVDDIRNSYLTIAKPDKKLSIIKVDVKSEDEIFSKRFNEELVQNVNDFYVQTKTKKSLDNVYILQHKTDSVKAVMNGAIFRAVSIADATPNQNPTRQVQRIVPMQKAQFSSEMNKAILEEMVKNLEMSKMALMKETPLIQVVDRPIYPLQKDSIGKAKGIVLGGIIFGFLATLILLFRAIVKNIMLA